MTASRTHTTEPSRRTFVLDTSVLLSDPGALGRFAEHEVVLPLVVISELEGKRHHPELGWFARQTLRVLDELRIEHGRLDSPVPIGDDGCTVVVDGTRHVFDTVYPVLGSDAQGELAVALGADCDDDGALVVDASQQTSVEGLYACGDIVSALNQISVAVGQAAIAATAVHNRLPRNPVDQGLPA